MSRCKSCNTKMYDSELNKLDNTTPSGYRELCNRCFKSSLDEYEYSEDHTYAFEDLEEGLTPSKTSVY